MAVETFAKKRIEILAETPVIPKVTALLKEKGALGFTVLPAVSGFGPHGEWSREGMVGVAGQMQMVLCIVSEEKKDALLDDLFQLLSRHIGFLAISDCEVVRSERF